jgi:RIO kinase 2
MSRLAAQKEFAFMKVRPLRDGAAPRADDQVLYENGYPVPVPIDQVRHGIVMSWIDSFPLYVPPLRPQYANELSTDL